MPRNFSSISSNILPKSVSSRDLEMLFGEYKLDRHVAFFSSVITISSSYTCYNVHPTLTQHFLSSFWRVPLEGGGEKDQLFTTFFYKILLLVTKRTRVYFWWYWLARFISAKSRHDLPNPLSPKLPCFPNNSNAIIKKNLIDFFFRLVGEKKEKKNYLSCLV